MIIVRLEKMREGSVIHIYRYSEGKMDETYGLRWQRISLLRGFARNDCTSPSSDGRGLIKRSRVLV